MKNSITFNGVVYDLAKLTGAARKNLSGIPETELESGSIKKENALCMDPNFIVCTVVVNHDFVKDNASDFADQLDAFSAALNLPTSPTALATKYGLSTERLLSIKNDAASWRFFNTKHVAGPIYAKEWTAKGHELRKGTGISSSAWPVGVDVLTPPIVVPPGIENRFRENAAFIKSQKSINTEADNIVLHISVNSAPFVPGDGKPDLVIKLSDGGHPVIKYLKSNYVGIAIYKDSGDGAGMVFLMTCNDPEGTDMSPLPMKGKSAAWVYKAIYIYDSKTVGDFSDEVTITVLGNVTVPPPII